MRSFNRARLSDIAEKKLNPKEKLVVGKDGKLTSAKPKSSQPSSVSKVDNSLTSKENKKEEVQEVVNNKTEETDSLDAVVVEKLEETKEDVVLLEVQGKAVEKKIVKKKPFSKSQPS